MVGARRHTFTRTAWQSTAFWETERWKELSPLPSLTRFPTADPSSVPWVSLLNPNSVTLWIAQARHHYCFWEGFGSSIGPAGRAFASITSYPDALIVFQFIDRPRFLLILFPVLPLRLTGCSALRLYTRASLPACSVLKPICCTGLPSFHVQTQCLFSTLLQLRLTHRHRDFEGFFHVFRHGVPNWPAKGAH